MVAHQPEPDLADRGRHLDHPAVHVEPADQAEVDVDDPVGVEVEEQVLAGRLGGQQRGAVELRGLGGEASLGAAHPHRPTGEGVAQCGGEPVEGVALRHGLATTGSGSRAESGSGGRSPVDS